jgi:CBS domain-containing protein
MKVRALASRPPVTARPDISIKEAAAVMARRRIGLLVLVEGDGIYGVVSERDIVRAVAGGVDMGRPVALIATRDVVTVDADAPVAEAARLMYSRGIRHLVVTEGGRLYGVLSVRDLIGEAVQLERAVEGGEAVEMGMPAD